MSSLEWKSFNFFKLEVIDNAEYKRISSTVTAHCGNSVYKIFCTARGVIHIFLANWENVIFTVTNNPIIGCAITDEGDTLVIVVQTPAMCQIKCYSVLNLLDRKQVPPLCSAAINKLHIVNSALQMSLLVAEQLWIAIGLERGTVLLYKASSSRTVLSLNATLQVCFNPIKGIAFVRRLAGDTRMCVCSDKGIYYYNIFSENCNETKQVFDDLSDSVSCCTIMPTDGNSDEQYFVVGKKDAIYCYTSEGLGRSFPISGTKKLLGYCAKHIYVVVNVPAESSSEQSPTFMSHVIILNIDNNMIVFNEVLSEVLCLYPGQYETKSLIFMSDGTIFTQRDQGIEYKLQLLYEKNLYDIALKLVEKQNVHPSIVADVTVRYADYLLQRGDLAAAVEMFIRTIGYISPFRVISRLLNIRYNEYIIQYLKVLIDSGHAYSECRSLHQNCCRRMDLPTAIGHIFKNLKCDSSSEQMTMDQTNKLLSLFGDTSQSINGINISNADVRENGNDVIDISPCYEHWVVSNWPLNAADILKVILTHKNFQNVAFREKIIQIFLSLLFPNKKCVLDVISSIYSEQKPNPAINLIWAEILMQMWKSKSMDGNCVLEFFRSQKLQMNEDVHIICHTHKFWPGIKMVHDGNEMDALAMPWAHDCEICPFAGSDVGTSPGGVSYQMLMQTLRKKYNNSNHSSAVFQKVVSNIFHHNPHNMLTVLQKVVTSAPFNIADINKVLTKEVIIKRLSLQCFDDIAELQKKLEQMKALLKGYANSPIEFRNSTCDACKQSLKQPSVYYTCQHAYHKECVVSYSESNCCIVCTNNVLKLNADSAKKVKQANTAGHQSSTFRFISNKLTVPLPKSTKISYNEPGFVAREIMPAVSKNPFDVVSEIDSSNKSKAITSSTINTKDKRVNVQSTNPCEDGN